MFAANNVMRAARGGLLQVRPIPVVETGSNTSLALSKPVSTKSGDLLISLIGAEFAGTTITWTAGAGFTERLDSTNFEVASLVAGGSEPSSYTFTSAGGGFADKAGTILRIKGGAYDTIGAPGSTSTTPSAPSITMTVDGLLLALFFALASRTFTTPTGMFPITAYSTGPSFAVFGQYVSAGATGTRQSTASGSGQNFGALLGVKPA